MRAYHLRTALQKPEFITGLYLNRMELTEVPPEVFRLPNLRELDLSYNRIERLPGEMARLTKLERLVLSHNRIGQLPFELGRLGALREVWLDHNALIRWPEALERLPALQILRLGNNQLEDLPESVGAPSGLRELDLSCNRIGKLPGSIGRWSALRELKLAHNRLGRLPVALGECGALDRLDLSHNRLRDLPASLEKLERLGWLDLSGNRLAALPGVVFSFLHLRHLAAADNRIEAPPEAIGKLRWLAHVDLSGNRLTQLSGESLAACAHLQTLRLDKNALTELPDLTPLSRLRRLEVSLNQLRRWPSLSPGLKVLILGRNALEGRPPETEEWRSLEQLDLSYNALTELPANFSELRELRALDLRRTALEEWPASLIQLDNLQALKTDWPAAWQKTFFRLLRACAQAGTPGVVRDQLCRLLRQDGDRLRELPVSTLFHAANLRYPELRRLVRPELFRRYGRPDLVLAPGDRLFIAGRTALPRRTLIDRLRRQRIEAVDQPDPETRLVLLGEFPDALPEWDRFAGAFLTERQVIAWLDEQEDRFLRTGAGLREIGRLRELLLHEDPVNVQLAVQMMQGGGVPAALLTELLIAWKKAGPGKLRRALKQMLWQYAPEGARANLELPLSLSPDQPEALLRANIARVCTGTPFEEEKLLRAAGLL